MELLWALLDIAKAVAAVYLAAGVLFSCGAMLDGGWWV